jgi:hypothetical protein
MEMSTIGQLDQTRASILQADITHCKGSKGSSHDLRNT